MDYRKIDGHAYNLHIINTNKFKKNIIKITFRGKLERADILKRRLIGNILLNANATYQTKRLLDIRTEELYNLEGLAQTVISGNSIETSFTSIFLNDKYTTDPIFTEALIFTRDMILKPIVEEGRFQKKAFDNAVKLVIEDINTIKEDPKKYASNRFLEEMDNGPFSYRSSGYLEDLEKINSKNLYEFYLDMLKTNKIDIFVIGNIGNINVEKEIRENIDFNTIKRIKLNSFIYHTRFRKRYRKVIEEFDTVQSTLKMGYKIEKMTDFERQYVMPVFNYILGGGPDSKLFMEVREKNSLCYSVGSSVRVLSHALVITSYIDKKNYKKAYKLINNVFQDMIDGKFTDSDIEKAKTIYLSVFKEIDDSELSILGNYATHEFFGTDLVEDRMKKIMKVTKKDVLKLAHKIHPDTFYLLEGVKNEEE